MFLNIRHSFPVNHREHKLHFYDIKNNMRDVKVNLEAVRKRITKAEQLYGREPGSVQLVAVSKTKPVELIEEAIVEEQMVFGENYIQEGVGKIDQLNKACLQWHFIGPIQSNKTKLLAENFLWVHSVDRTKIAQRLSSQRPPILPSLNICIQVNINGESSKAGVTVSELPQLIRSIIKLPHLTLRGFMAIPEREDDFHKQRLPFKQLKEALINMNQTFDLQMDTLSMGMSGDLEAAIAEGATLVRVGADIFGARTVQN